MTEQVEGDAQLAAPGGTGAIHYTQPEDKTMPLPQGTLFPMAHTEAIITAAEAGKKFLTLPLFDGTGAEGAQNTSVVDQQLGRALRGALSRSGRAAVRARSRGLLRPQDHAQAPDYEVGMRYWENGVADGLNMDFSDFAVNGKLVSFTIPAPALLMLSRRLPLSALRSLLPLAARAGADPAEAAAFVRKAGVDLAAVVSGAQSPGGQDGPARPLSAAHGGRGRGRPLLPRPLLADRDAGAA